MLPDFHGGQGTKSGPGTSHGITVGGTTVQGLRESEAVLLTA